MNGVVHVGAHTGEEVPQYVAEGRDPIICFEPLDLPHDIHGTFVRVALSDQNGWLDMLVPYHIGHKSLDTMMASGCRLHDENAKSIGLTPTACESVRVPKARFDAWASLTHFRRDCSLLVIDAHGMELAILRGFGDYLNEFKELRIELYDPPLFDGGPNAHEVVAFLAEKGFQAVTPITPCGDVEFRKVI